MKSTDEQENVCQINKKTTSSSRTSILIWFENLFISSLVYLRLLWSMISLRFGENGNDLNRAIWHFFFVGPALDFRYNKNNPKNSNWKFGKAIRFPLGSCFLYVRPNVWPQQQHQEYAHSCTFATRTLSNMCECAYVSLIMNLCVISTTLCVLAIVKEFRANSMSKLYNIWHFGWSHFRFRWIFLNFFIELSAA